MASSRLFHHRAVYRSRLPRAPRSRQRLLIYNHSGFITMDGQTNAPRQSPEDRGKARQDSTTPSVHSVTTDDRQPSPRARRRHSGRVARSGAQSSGAQRNTLRRRSSSRSESFGPHPGSSRDITAAMQRSLGPFEPEPISYTPTTHRVSKAKKGKRVHACEYPGCDKVCRSTPPSYIPLTDMTQVFTRAEHRRYISLYSSQVVRWKFY